MPPRLPRGRLAVILLVAAAGIAVAQELHPWREASAGAQREEDARSELEADASGMLATGGESENWYLHQAANVERERTERTRMQQEEMTPGAPPPSRSNMEKRYEKLGEAAARQEKIDDAKQIQDSVFTEHQREQKVASAESELAEEAQTLGDSQMQGIQQEAQRRKMQIKHKLRGYMDEAKREQQFTASERGQKTAYGHEVERLGEAADHQMETDAEAKEGHAALLLSNAVATATEVADYASNEATKAKARTAAELESIRAERSEHTDRVHSEIKAKFEVHAIQARMLVQHGELLDDDAKRYKVQAAWSKYLAGQQADRDTAPDIKTMVGYDIASQKEKAHLPNIAQAEKSVDPVGHPCGAVDQLTEDPLCSLANRAIDAEQDAVSGKIERINDIESIDDPISLVEVKEAQGQQAGTQAGWVDGYATLHAADADKVITKATDALNKKDSERAQLLDKELETELKTTGAPARRAAEEAWYNAQKQRQTEIDRGQFAEKYLPLLMKKRTAFVMQGAQQHLLNENKNAEASEAEALHQNKLRKQATASEANLRIEMIEANQNVFHQEAASQMKQALKVYKPRGPTEQEKTARAAAKRAVVDRQNMILHGLEFQDHETKFLQKDELRSLDATSQQMALAQKEVDQVAGPLLNIDAAHPVDHVYKKWGA